MSYFTSTEFPTRIKRILKQLIESLSPRTEFATVILGAFGLSILGSISSAFAPGPPAPISDDALMGLVVYEVVVMALLGMFLAMRGWRLSAFGMAVTFKDTGIGYLLAAAIYAAYAIAWAIVNLYMPANADFPVSGQLRASTVVVLSLVNAVFEELFVCGYLINALKSHRGVVFAINVSVAIRLAYHLYQGPFSVLHIVPMGLIFGYWFARTGRLWPPVVAHAALDLLSLWGYVE